MELTTHARLKTPPIGEIEMNLVGQAALQSDAHAIADEQHADHQFGIDRRPASVAVERLQRVPNVFKVEMPVDAAELMVGRHVIVKAEVVAVPDVPEFGSLPRLQQGVAFFPALRGTLKHSLWLCQQTPGAVGLGRETQHGKAVQADHRRTTRAYGALPSQRFVFIDTHRRDARLRAAKFIYAMVCFRVRRFPQSLARSQEHRAVDAHVGASGEGVTQSWPLGASVVG